jgi:hypothetical protein
VPTVVSQTLFVIGVKLPRRIRRDP